MRCRIFHFVALLSLLLCVVTVVLWVRSYDYIFELKIRTALNGSGEEVVILWNNDRHIMRLNELKVETFPGHLYVTRRAARAYAPHFLQPNPEDGDGVSLQTRRINSQALGESQSLVPTIAGIIREDGGRAVGGFGLGTHNYEKNLLPSHGYDVSRRVLLPFWPMALLFALLPVIRTARWTRTFVNLRLGRCPNCSYNLTGNASGVCPECGTAVVGKAEGVA